MLDEGSIGAFVLRVSLGGNKIESGVFGEVSGAVGADS
jgi:hypothetical protein